MVFGDRQVGLKILISIPFGIARLSFLKFETKEFDVLGQLLGDFVCEINDHHFACWLIIHQKNFVASRGQLMCQLYVRCVFVEYGSVIKNIDNFIFDDPFEISKIDDHSIFHMVFVGNWGANNSHRKLVTVAMYIAAFAIVPIKGVTCFEGEHLGDADLTHAVKIQYFAFKRGVQTAGEASLILWGRIFYGQRVIGLFEFQNQDSSPKNEPR